ncbi:MAG: twin-arginine translocase subunit TatC [Phycisphaerae bacterium]
MHMPTSTDQPQLDPESTTRMGLGDHLDDLRRRILYALAGVVITTSFCLYYAQDMVGILVRPYRMTLARAGFPDTLVFSAPAEVVMNLIWIGLMAGGVLAAPWVIYQLWCFVAQGLYPKERRLVYKLIGPSVLLFLGGVAFFIIIILPITLNFFVEFARDTTAAAPTASWIEQKMFAPEDTAALANLPTGDQAVFPPIPLVRSDPTTTAPAGQYRLWYNAQENRLKSQVGDKTFIFMQQLNGTLFTPLPNLNDYLDFVLILSLVFGLSFQLPLIMVVLSRINIVRAQTFAKARKIAILGIVIFAAVATPTTDMFTMCLLAVPLIILYEAGIWIGRWTQPPAEPETPDTTTD